MSWTRGSIESRARRVFLLVLALLGLLVSRAGYIQLVRGDELAQRARRQQFIEITVPAPRGRILDRWGRPLTASYHARTIAADPQRIEDPQRFSVRLAFLLGEPEAAAEFAARIAARRREGKRFVYLRRRIDREVAEMASRAGLPGLIVREEPRRDYPHGRAAAAVLGVVGADADGRIAGRTGLERRFDRQLRGRDGIRRIFRSGKQESLQLFPEKSRPPQPGEDLHTTLDLVVQQVVEEALDGLQERYRPKSSCAVVLDPETGEILALAGRPALDPARFPAVDKRTLDVPAVQYVYEPGSTFKPLIMAWALTCGVVSPDQTIDCGPGVRFFGGRRLRDVRPHGRLPLADILVKSSNIGIATVGQALGCEQACALLSRLGFGRRTGVELAGEPRGIVTERSKWRCDYTLVSVSMGHEVAVTPLQLAVAYAALLNGGTLFQPTLLRDAPRPAPRRVPFDPDAIEFVRRAMERVVEEGTGRRARVPGLCLAGKTGTAEKYPEGSGRYVSSFIGFAPVDRPRLLVYVVADEPQANNGLKPYGGVVAAPVVGEILRRALPLVADRQSTAPSESGVRHNQSVTSTGKVRVAAVHRSSVWAGERDFPAASRNPDSGGAVLSRRSAR